jgi:hypothetical protein
MEIHSLIKAIFDPKQQISALSRNAVRLGDQFLLKIVEPREGGRALVDLGQFRAVAEIKFPVQAGDEFLAEVVNTAKPLKLSLIRPDTQAGSSPQGDSQQGVSVPEKSIRQLQTALKHIFSEFSDLHANKRLSPGILAVLMRLKSHFSAIDPTRGTDQWLPRLKAAIENSGIFLEKKIKAEWQSRPENQVQEPLRSKNNLPASQPPAFLRADLKANLLILREFLDQTQAERLLEQDKHLRTLRECVERMIKEVVHQQQEAVHRQAGSDPHQTFTFLLPLKDENQKAKLKIYYPKKTKSGSSAGYKISLLLALHKIGEVRSDLGLWKKDLSIHFSVKDESLKQFLEFHFPEIRQRLGPLFSTLTLSAAVSEKRIEEFSRTHWDSDSERRVNLRI